MRFCFTIFLVGFRVGICYTFSFWRCRAYAIGAKLKPIKEADAAVRYSPVKRSRGNWWGMREYVLLYVNRKPVEIRGDQVFMMLAHFLRYELLLTGTKIVCAEG